MKVYQYSYYIKYGQGVGIVVAPSEKTALKMIKEKEGDDCPRSSKIKIEKLDLRKPMIESMTWII